MIRAVYFALSIAFVFSTAILAADKAPLTNDQKAQALVEKGLAYLQANGKEKAIAAFTDPKGAFVAGDLYIFVDTYEGKCLAHINPKLVNQDQLEIVDADGREIMKEFINVAKTQGKGWIEYKWTSPQTKKIQEKKTYIVNVEGQNMFLGCGFYK